MNYKKNGKFALALRIKNKGQGATVQPISASGLKDACSLLYQSWSDPSSVSAFESFSMPASKRRSFSPHFSTRSLWDVCMVFPE
ncbi:MAG: hypothetical protein ACJ0BN_00850 [Limisphaerales bacterium]